MSTGIPILRQTSIYTTDRDTYHVRVYLLAPLWHYASVLTGAGTYLPGIVRRRCYAESPEMARLGAWQEITRVEAMTEEHAA